MFHKVDVQKAELEILKCAWEQFPHVQESRYGTNWKSEKLCILHSLLSARLGNISIPIGHVWSPVWGLDVDIQTHTHVQGDPLHWYGYTLVRRECHHVVLHVCMHIYIYMYIYIKKKEGVTRNKH